MNVYLNDIIDLQLDSFISTLLLNNKLTILFEKVKTTEQYLHMSTLGNDNVCKICDMDANNEKYNSKKNIHDLIKQYSFLVLLIIFTFVFCLVLFIKKTILR